MTRAPGLKDPKRIGLVAVLAVAIVLAVLAAVLGMTYLAAESADGSAAPGSRTDDLAEAVGAQPPDRQGG